MSFFHLTSLGYENRFKSMQHLEPIGIEQFRQAPTGGQPKNSFDKQRAREMTNDFQSREWSTPAISNLNYHSLRRMHVRGDGNSHQMVRQPVTVAQEVGWWLKDEPLKSNEPWTQQKRYAHAQSEMTKFVDDMSLGNPYFRLF